MIRVVASIYFLFSMAFLYGQTNSVPIQTKQEHEYFLDFFTSKNKTTHKEALNYIEKNWKPSFEAIAIESLYFLRSPSITAKLLRILQKKTKKQYRYDFDQWYKYLWNKDPEYLPSYFTFKARLHRAIDERFGPYFLDREKLSTIRLDEVRWGGVKQDGIPPLRNPKMIPVKKASYLNDTDIVFGIAINGDTRAYPKRILAWHELFTDTVGGIPVAGVYCNRKKRDTIPIRNQWFFISI